MPVPAALKPITSSLILLSHNFLNFCASLSFFENFDGIGAIILFLEKLLQGYQMFFQLVISQFFLFTQIFKNTFI